MNAKELVEKMSPELLKKLDQLDRKELKEILSRAIENVKMKKEIVKDLSNMVQKDLLAPLKKMTKEQVV